MLENGEKQFIIVSWVSERDGKEESIDYAGNFRVINSEWVSEHRRIDMYREHKMLLKAYIEESEPIYYLHTINFLALCSFYQRVWQ